jgi:hypothetical protein
MNNARLITIVQENEELYNLKHPHIRSKKNEIIYYENMYYVSTFYVFSLFPRLSYYSFSSSNNKAITTSFLSLSFCIVHCTVSDRQLTTKMRMLLKPTVT